MDKRERTARQRQEDAALVKILYWMSGAALLVILLRLAQRYYVDFDSSDAGIDLAYAISKSLPWVLGLGLVLAAGAFFLAYRAAGTGKSVHLPVALGTFSLGLSGCALGIWQGGASGIQVLTYGIIGLGILAMIYYLYQRDFAVVALVSGLGLAGIWLRFRLSGGLRLYVLLTVLLAALTAIAVLTWVLQSKGGAIVCRGKRVELLPAKGTAYSLIYLSCGLMVLSLLAALALGGALSAMIFYAVPVAWALIMAVYYTVKLM